MDVPKRLAIAVMRERYKHEAAGGYGQTFENFVKKTEGCRAKLEMAEKKIEEAIALVNLATRDFTQAANSVSRE